MAILSKGTTYADGTQVTATNLNALVDSATFASGAVDDSTTQLSSGAVIVKDLGIATGKIAASAVTTAKIADSNVTKAKIENVANMKALGNVSGSAAAPAEVAILDEDNMASNSATSLATQQSIKAYTDSKVDGTGAGSFTTLAASGDVTFDTSTLKVDSSNNRVGVGTASPLKKLHIASDANGQTTADIPGIRIENTDTTATDTNVAGEIEFFSKDASEADKISGFIKNVAEDAGTKYGLAFGAKATGSNATEAVRINSSGNVGIGTSDPDYLLDINDDAATGVGIRVTGGGGGGPLARFSRDVSSSGTVEINIAAGDPQFKLTSSGSDVMAVGLDGSDNAFQVCSGNTVGSNQVLVVGINGKVGIGETVPSAPLTVTSTTGGVLMPRMTTTQMNAISSPANGEMIYNTTANKFYGYAGGAWVALH